MARLPRYGEGGFAAALSKLLPRGRAWPRDPSSVLMRFVSGLAAIFADVEQRAAAFLEREIDPRTTLDMLPEWERAFGLPDPCFPAGQAIGERQAQLVARIAAQGGASPQYFIDLAASLGYAITIEEFAPFMAGWSRAGDPFWQMGDPSIRFFWIVNVPGARVTWFRAGLGIAGQDPHARIARADDLECILRRWKPSHTQLVFSYSGA